MLKLPIEAVTKEEGKFYVSKLVEKQPGKAKIAEKLEIKVGVRNATDQEFTALPTLARAYTTGAVELLASGFHHPLIPVAYRTALVDRWNSLAARRPEVLDALEEAGL